MKQNVNLREILDSSIIVNWMLAILMAIFIIWYCFAVNDPDMVPPWLRWLTERTHL